MKLKLQSCKLCNNKYMITSTQRTNIEIFIAVVFFEPENFCFKLLKSKLHFKKIVNFTGKLLQSYK